jgi:hypothetical protein
MATEQRFAICISNEECDDLEMLRVYRVLPDERAAEDSLLRVIDGSGEDYLYSAERFVVVELSPTEQQRLAEAAAR